MTTVPEIVGDTIIIIFGVILVILFGVIVATGKVYFWEPNIYIAWAEFMMAVAILFIGFDRFHDDLRRRKRTKV